jgi:hypothetical protein
VTSGKWVKLRMVYISMGRKNKLIIFFYKIIASDVLVCIHLMVWDMKCMYPFTTKVIGAYIHVKLSPI